jgi:hypothetical protein
LWQENIKTEAGKMDLRRWNCLEPYPETSFDITVVNPSVLTIKGF